MNEIEWCKKYISGSMRLLRSETAEDAWRELRNLQELEEEADKNGKTVFIEARLIDH